TARAQLERTGPSATWAAPRARAGDAIAAACCLGGARPHASAPAIARHGAPISRGRRPLECLSRRDALRRSQREVGLPARLRRSQKACDAARYVCRPRTVNARSSAIDIEPDATIAGWVASGAEAIEQLVNEVLETSAHDAGLAIGTGTPRPP